AHSRGHCGLYPADPEQHEPGGLRGDSPAIALGSLSLDKEPEDRVQEEAAAIMRVVFNQLVALKQKTGIGHYANQLFRSLRAHAGTDEIESYPTGWLRHLYKGCVRTRPLFGSKEGLPRGDDGLPRLLSGVRSCAAHHLRRLGLAVLSRQFQ